MKHLNSDLFPFALLVILILVGFIAFWSVADVVILGASLAVVLIPLHHRISEHTIPEISAAIVTLAIFLGGCIMVLFTYLVLSSNVVILTGLFGTIGIWLNNPATNPLDFGIPVAKATLFDLLNKGTALFVDYQATLLGNLSLIVFRIFVFFVSLFSLLRWGERAQHEIHESRSRSFVRVFQEVVRSNRGYAVCNLHCPDRNRGSHVLHSITGFLPAGIRKCHFLFLPRCFL